MVLILLFVVVLAVVLVVYMVMKKKKSEHYSGDCDPNKNCLNGICLNGVCIQGQVKLKNQYGFLDLGNYTDKLTNLCNGFASLTDTGANLRLYIINNGPQFFSIGAVDGLQPHLDNAGYWTLAGPGVIFQYTQGRLVSSDGFYKIVGTNDRMVYGVPVSEMESNFSDQWEIVKA